MFAVFVIFLTDLLRDLICVRTRSELCLKWNDHPKQQGKKSDREQSKSKVVIEMQDPADGSRWVLVAG